MSSKAKPFAWQGFTASFGFALGDISISMIYAFKAVFISQDGKPDGTIVLGVLSMIFWLIMLISVLKYSIIMMRADNKGEGGLFALYSIVRKYWKYMPIIAIIGGACLMADAVFAPSNTILTIIEGMPSVNAINNNPFWNQGMAMFTAVIIIIILFATQHHRHGGNGRNYGIIMMIYLAFSGIVGIYWIIQYPWILTAMNPMNAIKFIIGSDVGHVIGILSCISLAISGSEALTANQGQYGKKNIKASWSIALICIFMSYFGQGAFILKTMTALDAGDPSPYFLMIMEPLRPFALILALMTGIIACQSLLNSAFVLAQAADGLGWIPRLKISYNGMDKGKVYVSSLNVVLCLMSIAIVLFFRTSTAMESAYNLALTTAMFMDTIMIWFWYRNIRMKPLSGTILCILFGAAELVMLTTSMIMVIEGAYVTISIAIIIMGILYVCMKGQKIERSRRRRINADKLVPMLSTVINDENMDMIADNLIYLTPDANMDNVEKDIAINHVRGHRTSGR